VLRAPTPSGAYRLLVDVFDGHGSVTSHSFPFFVGSLRRAQQPGEKIGFTHD
jgi:hypothetical protein